MPTGTTLLLVALVAEWGGIAHLAPPGRPWRPLAVALGAILAQHLGLFSLGEKSEALAAALGGLFFLYVWSAQPRPGGLLLTLTGGLGILWSGAPLSLVWVLAATILQFGGGESEATAGIIGALTLWSVWLGAHPGGAGYPWPYFDFAVQTLLFTAALGRARGLWRRPAGPAREEAHVNP